MTPQEVMDIAYQGMRFALLLGGPLLLAALATGLLVSLFQAATQLNEMTLTFIPKILAVFAVMIFTGPWLLEVMYTFTTRLFNSIPNIAS